MAHPKHRIKTFPFVGTIKGMYVKEEGVYRYPVFEAEVREADLDAFLTLLGHNTEVKDIIRRYDDVYRVLFAIADLDELLAIFPDLDPLLPNEVEWYTWDNVVMAGTVKFKNEEGFEFTAEVDVFATGWVVLRRKRRIRNYVGGGYDLTVESMDGLNIEAAVIIPSESPALRQEWDRMFGDHFLSDPLHDPNVLDVTMEPSTAEWHVAVGPPEKKSTPYSDIVVEIIKAANLGIGVYE